jgi:hypothetical protein
VHDFGPGEFPDGFAFDGEGGVWVACVNANRVIRIERGGRRTLILDGAIPERIAEGEADFNADQGGRQHVELGAARRSRTSPASLSAGRISRQCASAILAGDRIRAIRRPIAESRAGAVAVLTARMWPPAAGAGRVRGY